MRQRFLMAGGAVLAAVAVSAACGESQTDLSVRLTDDGLRPSRAEIGDPGEVRFRVRNVGSAPHALVVVGSKEEVETEPLAPGGRTTFRLDLDEPGRYRWYLDGRGAGGMRGVIVVD